VHKDSAAWIFYTYISFAIAGILTVTGIQLLPVEFWTRAYLLMGTCFLVGSTFTLSKTLRDQHEAAKLVNRLEEAKTERLLKEYTHAQ
jgi:hypothetical protein